MNKWDPDGFGWITKAWKAVKIVYKSVKKGRILNKAELADTFVDNVKDFNALRNATSFGEAIGPALSLASELAPVSKSDVKDAGRLVGLVKDAKKVDPSDVKKVEKKVQNARHSRKTEEAAQEGAEAASKREARFIADANGNVVDLKATPKGRHIQPDGSATDILQDAAHPHSDSFVSRTHTHDAVVNVNPADPTKGSTRLSKDIRPVTAEEVKNIQDGRAIPSQPRGR